MTKNTTLVKLQELSKLAYNETSTKNTHKHILMKHQLRNLQSTNNQNHNPYLDILSIKQLH